MKQFYQCRSVVLFTMLFLLAGCSPKDMYIASCTDNPELESSFSTMYGNKGKERLDALCECKYREIVKSGIADNEIKKILDGEYGIMDGKARDFAVAEFGAGLKCLGLTKGSDK